MYIRFLYKQVLTSLCLSCTLVVAAACNPQQQTEAKDAAAVGTMSAAARPAPDTALTRQATPPDSTAKDSAAAPKTAAARPTGAILPEHRIVAFYGNPMSKRMGILGELPEDQMLAKLDQEVAAWQKADSTKIAIPALHLIAVTAQGKPGKGEKYRLRMSPYVVNKVLAMAEKRNAIVFLDVQVGRSTLQAELPLLAKYLKNPHVHLGIDAEFAMGETGVPGRKIGTYDAEDVNYASQFLADLAKEHNLPPKILVVHRFTQRMITNYKNIELRDNVQIVMHMDGWGHPVLKKDTYKSYIAREPVQYTGFKLFYKNDLKKPGSRLMKPEEVLKLNPVPVYIQYQ